MFRKMYRSISSPVLYRRETCFHTKGIPNDKEVRKQSTKKNIWEKDEVIKDRMKLDNEALYLY